MGRCICNLISSQQVLVVGALQNSLMLERMSIYKYECLFLVIWIYWQHFHQFLLLPLIYRLRVLERMSALNFYSLRIIRLMPSKEKKFLVITSVPVLFKDQGTLQHWCFEQPKHKAKVGFCVKVANIFVLPSESCLLFHFLCLIYCFWHICMQVYEFK
jgi:hypothetical protein